MVWSHSFCRDTWVTKTKSWLKLKLKLKQLTRVLYGSDLKVLSPAYFIPPWPWTLTFWRTANPNIWSLRSSRNKIHQCLRKFGDNSSSTFEGNKFVLKNNNVLDIWTHGQTDRQTDRHTHEYSRNTMPPATSREDGQTEAYVHRRRSSVSFRRARHFCPKNMYENLKKWPNFTWFLPEKLTKFRILHDFCTKNTRILHNNRPKNIFPNFGGPGLSPMPMKKSMLTLLVAISLTDLWVWMVSSCSRHHSSSSSVSVASFCRCSAAKSHHIGLTHYVAAKATYIRLLHGKIGFLAVFRP